MARFILHIPLRISRKRFQQRRQRLAGYYSDREKAHLGGEEKIRHYQGLTEWGTVMSTGECLVESWGQKDHVCGFWAVKSLEETQFIGNITESEAQTQTNWRRATLYWTCHWDSYKICSYAANETFIHSIRICGQNFLSEAKTPYVVINQSTDQLISHLNPL